ncbi:MAG TPA: hypothetical protein VFO48_00660 [Vicinamibacterales bacterium]|nr:hypothetical protein [Vicinamibacterales bacterium]
MISAAGATGTSMRELFIVALLLWPHVAIAQDKWFAPDKAKHFGAGAAISAGTYAAAVPLTARTRWRITIGTTAGIAAAAGKELRDRRRGGGSWRDFAWTAGGTASGIVMAWIIDKATD